VAHLEKTLHQLPKKKKKKKKETWGVNEIIKLLRRGRFNSLKEALKIFCCINYAHKKMRQLTNSIMPDSVKSNDL